MAGEKDRKGRNLRFTGRKGVLAQPTAMGMAENYIITAVWGLGFGVWGLEFGVVSRFS
jgi:hypothetical protein